MVCWDVEETAYYALHKALTKVCNRNRRSQQKEWKKRRRSMNTFRYEAPEEHREVLDAIEKLKSGEMSPEEAFTLAQSHGVIKITNEGLIWFK
jgi:hypothetical protein